MQIRGDFAVVVAAPGVHGGWGLGGSFLVLCWGTKEGGKFDQVPLQCPQPGAGGKRTPATKPGSQKRAFPSQQKSPIATSQPQIAATRKGTVTKYAYKVQKILKEAV